MSYKEEAEEKRQEIMDAVVARFGGVSARQAALLNLYRDNVALYLRARDDVENRGLRESYVNGSQRTSRKNVAIDQMAKATGTLTRLLNAILPENRKGTAPEDDAEDEDDDLNDY